MKEVVIGIDIGGTNSRFGVVDKSGDVLVKNSIPTNTHKDARVYVKDLSKAIDETIESIKKINKNVIIKGIGLGAPNGNYYNGTIEYAPNLNFEGIVPLVDLLKEHYDYPAIVLTNDANAAALGEMIFGGAKKMKDFIMITLGTGVGSGIVSNGNLVYGHDGFAGEIGHVIVRHRGRECGCSRKGCLETYASAGGIKRTIFELLAKKKDKSVLRDCTFNQLTAIMITEAAEQGDTIALEAFEVTGEILGRALADSIAYTSPEAIFLFGGLANAGEFIFKPTLKYMEEYVLNIYKNKVKLLPSQLNEGDAAILGASALVWKELE